MTSTRTSCAVLPAPVMVIMDRNDSLVSGYLWEIPSSAKEPREDLRATQNSSETRLKDFFFHRGNFCLPGEGLVIC